MLQFIQLENLGNLAKYIGRVFDCKFQLYIHKIQKHKKLKQTFLFRLSPKVRDTRAPVEGAWGTALRSGRAGG